MRRAARNGPARRNRDLPVPSRSVVTNKAPAIAGLKSFLVMHERIRFLITCILLLAGTLQVQAQTVTTSFGRLTVTPAAVSYQTPALDTTISRDLLATLPRAGRYQFAADDVALILDAALWQGDELPAWAPAADTTLSALLDSLESAAGHAVETIGEQREAIDSLTVLVNTRDHVLEQLRGELDAAKRERDRALGEVAAFRDFAAAVRRVVEVLTKR